MSSTPEDSAAPVPPSEPAVQSGTSGSGKPPPRKRRRTVISCTECHRRKQKCDRKLPCTNCVSRNKQLSCRYETGAYPTISRLDPQTTLAAAGENTTSSSSTSTEIALNTFGYAQGSTSTLNFLQHLEDPTSPSHSVPQLPISDNFPSTPALDQRYKSLLRQLPPKIYIQKLVPVYIREFNWAYATIDVPYFYSQLNSFNSLPFAQLSSPSTVPSDLRSFPALLFQICAVALLTLPAEGDKEFDGLKYAGSMFFEDLAAEYSELGIQVLQTLGKRGMTLTTVTAGFIRGSFLKYQALVTESWHAIGGAIRDGMEIGLHTHNNPHGERGKRVWMTLVMWDVHMACVLGRPTIIGLDLIRNGIILPQDDRHSEHDPPTPLSRALWGYKVMSPMREILEVEKEGPSPSRGFAEIDRLHGECVRLSQELPACFRLDSPDTQWDLHKNCYWLPWARVLMPQIMSVQLMALHRPYIFIRRESRFEALKACLEMLDAQRLHFAMLKPNMYKTFSLFFGTFDAIVLISTIYILFPKEHPQFLSAALQHFHWAVERFQAMSIRNSLAKAALGVLHAIRLRLDRSLLDNNKASSSSPATNSLWDTTPPSNTTTTNTSNTSPDSNDGGMISEYPPLPDTNTTTTSEEDHHQFDTETQSNSNNNNFDFSFPTNFDWSSVQPIFATNDLLYGNLSGTTVAVGTGTGTGSSDLMTNGDTINTTSWTDDGLLEAGTGIDWQFEGDFGSDTVWNLFNNFPPVGL